jgi:hypothetical protein
MAFLSPALRTPIVGMLLLAALGCSEPTPQSQESPQPKPAEAGALHVTFAGIGAVRAGMSLTEASKALGATLAVTEGTEPGACQYVHWPGGPDGVLLMLENQMIARVDVRSGTMATEAGARVGDSAEQIRRLYDGRVTATPHKYTDGQYLTVTSASPADGAFRLIFEIEGGKVTRYRSGKLPQVEYVEGCS